MFIRYFHLVLLALVFSAGMLRSQTLVSSFDDISFWVGQGSNQAAIVIDWKDGTSPSSFAWGFRWDGMATGEDMIRAVAGAIGTATDPATPNPGGDPALTLYTIFYASFGYAVDGLSYDSGNGQVHYESGFNPLTAGYWSYWIGEEASLTLPTWEFSMDGMGDRVLSNNSWDGWSWAEDFDGVAPDQAIAAVPEPSVYVLLMAVAGGWIFLRIRRKQAGYK